MGGFVSLMIPIKFAFVTIVSFAFFTFSPQIKSVLTAGNNVDNTNTLKSVSAEQEQPDSQKDTSTKHVSNTDKKKKQPSQGQDPVTWRDNPNNCDMSEQYVAKSDFSCIDKPDPNPINNQGSSSQTASQATQRTSVSLGGRERVAYNFYRNRGFTHTATAYLMGTIKQESGFRPNAFGDGGVAYGIYQWHPNRRAGMPDSFRGQLQWSVKELRQEYPSILSTFKTSSNPSKMTSAIYSWIRYGHTGKRYQYARIYLRKF